MAKCKKNIWLIGIISLFLLFFCLMGVGAVCAEASSDVDNDFDIYEAVKGKRVLFISSYSYAWDTVQIQIEGISDTLGDGVVLDYEFMDTKRVDDEVSLQLFHDGLAYRLSQVKAYDVVIVGDDAALKFALEYREELFDGIPLVFEGINDIELAQRAAEQPLVTGILEALSVEKNIDFALKIIPSARKVVAILDDTITGEAERKRFYSYADMYPDLEFTELNTSSMTGPLLRLALKSVTRDSILIYVVMTEDASGTKYTDLEAIQMIVDNVNVPVFRMVEGGIGDGLLGGNIVSMYKSGEIAAQLALDIMAGESADEMGIIMDSPNVYCVDAEMMEKFGVSLSVLPEDTMILNEKETFYEKNREVLIPGFVLVGALVVIIAWVLFDNYRRRKLMRKLEDARKIMESASQHDFLTGIPNRSKFMKDLQELITEKTPCTIMMIDIDDFKKINDTMGHTAGDEALQELANRLKEMGTDLLTPYRYAGDEFILILKSNISKIVEKTAYQCRQIFAKPFYLAGNKSKVCGSIGIASYPKDSDNLEQLVICADDAMYNVKKNGKNDFAFYAPHAEE